MNDILFILFGLSIVGGIIYIFHVNSDVQYFREKNKDLIEEKHFYRDIYIKEMAEKNRRHNLLNDIYTALEFKPNMNEKEMYEFYDLLYKSMKQRIEKELINKK